MRDLDRKHRTCAATMQVGQRHRISLRQLACIKISPAAELKQLPLARSPAAYHERLCDKLGWWTMKA